nr:J434 [uncultured bacterium]
MLAAEMLARLTADHPAATGDDLFALASILLMRAGSCRHAGLETYADVMEDEGRTILNAILANVPELTSAVAWLLNRLADEGDEWAAAALEQLVDALPAEQAAAVAADVAEVVREHKEEA